MPKAQKPQGRERANETRVGETYRRPMADTFDSPAAGAHATRHLTNEDATPGSGMLTSHAHRSGKEVDGGAG